MLYSCTSCACGVQGGDCAPHGLCCDNSCKQSATLFGLCPGCSVRHAQHWQGEGMIFLSNPSSRLEVSKYRVCLQLTFTHAAGAMQSMPQHVRMSSCSACAWVCPTLAAGLQTPGCQAGSLGSTSKRQHHQDCCRWFSISTSWHKQSC